MPPNAKLTWHLSQRVCGWTSLRTWQCGGFEDHLYHPFSYSSWSWSFCRSWVFPESRFHLTQDSGVVWGGLCFFWAMQTPLMGNEIYVKPERMRAVFNGKKRVCGLKSHDLGGVVHSMQDMCPTCMLLYSKNVHGCLPHGLSKSWFLLSFYRCFNTPNWNTPLSQPLPTGPSARIHRWNW